MWNSFKFQKTISKNCTNAKQYTKNANLPANFAEIEKPKQTQKMCLCSRPLDHEKATKEAVAMKEARQIDVEARSLHQPIQLHFKISITI